jgi:hypothetical protein
VKGRIALLLLLTANAHAAPDGLKISCENRLLRNSADCCWPGQAWSPWLAACVGAPACPSGFEARGDTCWLSCGEGRVADQETGGHCCWRGQVWSHEREECVGVPVCPPGYGARGQRCAPGCRSGQRASEDTAGHCCWPEQVWSERREECVGIPRCPGEYEVQGETCVVAAAPMVVQEPPRSVGRVRFVAAERDDRYQVRVQGHTCVTPCELELEARGSRVTFAGAAEFEHAIRVVPGEQRAVIRHRKTIVQTAGAFLLALGVGAIAATVALASDFARAGGVGVASMGALLTVGIIGAGSGVGMLIGAGYTDIKMEVQSDEREVGRRPLRAARGAIFSF